MTLKDEIEKKEGKPKVADPVEKVQKELKRMKIVNNRESLGKENVTDTQYVNREKGRVDMEDGKMRWSVMSIKHQIQEMDFGRIDLQHHHRDI